MAATKQLKLTMYRSMHGRLKAHQSCVKGLGIRKIHKSIVVSDTPENRGMINKISYMLHVEEV
jgi:large subunit ribosomal protein L30